jgi:hypothetical protein
MTVRVAFCEAGVKSSNTIYPQTPPESDQFDIREEQVLKTNLRQWFQRKRKLYEDKRLILKKLSDNKHRLEHCKMIKGPQKQPSN